MKKPASPQKRQANRRNALRSTGPKSVAGKRRSSANSTSHGLSTPIALDPLVNSLTELITQEGLNTQSARELVIKILDYERNLARQRALFAGGALTSPRNQLPTSAETDRGVRALFGREIDLLDDHVDWERFNNRPLTKRDQKFIVNQKLKMQKLWLRLSTRTQRSKAREEANSLRYLKRSSNQLIKALKALG